MNAASFIENFGHLANASSGVKGLRDLVSYFAISGNLSSQEAGDSDVLTLLTQTLEDKQRYLTKNKVRKINRKYAELRQTVARIPDHWALIPAGDLVHLINGRAFKSSEWMTSGVPIIRIQNLNSIAATFNHFQGELDAGHRIASGDILLSWSGTPGTSFGAFIWEGGDAALNQHIFKVIIFSDLMSKKYLKLSINACLGTLIGSARGGVGLKHVTKGQIEALQIPCPPLEEQKRIVSKVDELMALCDKLETQQQERERHYTTLSRATHDRFETVINKPNFEAVFDSRLKLSAVNLKRTFFSLAIRGALTTQILTGENGQDLIQRLFGEPRKSKLSKGNALKLPFDIPKTWATEKLGSLLQDGRGISYGIIKLGKEPFEDGVSVLRCSNVRYRCIDLTGMRSVTKDLSDDYGRTVLDGGELLVNVRGTLGGCAVVPPELKGFNIAREVAMIPIHQELDPHYLLCVISSPYFQDKVNASLRGIAYRGLNLGLLREFSIPVPPIEEQKRIVETTNRLIEMAEQLAGLQNEATVTGERFSLAAVSEITGNEAKTPEPMKTPKNELISNLKIAKKPNVSDDATLANILQKQPGELSAKSLWQQSGLEIDAFYQQLRTEIAAGWIVEPKGEDAYMKELPK